VRYRLALWDIIAQRCLHLQELDLAVSILFCKEYLFLFFSVQKRNSIKLKFEILLQVKFVLVCLKLINHSHLVA